ncbi:MAG: chromate resistance protein [Chloroflexi bacterium]|nr:MAG: chromate resistance protein [Chloroflexota bacterium]
MFRIRGCHRADSTRAHTAAPNLSMRTRPSICHGGGSGAVTGSCRAVNGNLEPRGPDSTPRGGSQAMKWVTREHPRTDRIACPWLIRKVIDPDAEIVYVPRDEVLAFAEREGATSFDAPGARYTHRDGKCSFETLVEEFHIDDPAIGVMARVVHGADVSEDADATPQSRGLEAIAEGFALLGLDDQRQLELELPVYDALYAWAQAQVRAA